MDSIITDSPADTIVQAVPADVPAHLSSAPSRARLLPLDGLRGIAALMVVVMHYVAFTDHSLWKDRVTNALRFGRDRRRSLLCSVRFSSRWNIDRPQEIAALLFHLLPAAHLSNLPVVFCHAHRLLPSQGHHPRQLGFLHRYSWLDVLFIPPELPDGSHGHIPAVVVIAYLVAGCRRAIL